MYDQSLDVPDLVVVFCYFFLIIAVGLWASCVSKRSSIQGYFLAGRSMSWFMIGASLFVSNIGSEHFVGLAGSGASGGIGVGAWELNALMLLQLLGWVFIPVYISSGISTMPEYLERRFGGSRLRIYLAVLTLILYCLTKISVNLYSGALFIKQAMGWPLYSSVTLLVCLTGLMTITGGLTVVMYTDSIQAVLMIFGAFYLTVAGFVRVGGYYPMKEAYMASSPNLTEVKSMYNITINATDACIPNPRPDSFKMLKEITDDEMPWLGFLLGQTPSSIWYWCTDQVIVQRALAARSLSHAQGGTLMAGFIKALPLYIMVMPGMISRILFKEDLVCVPGEHCLAVCGSESGCTNNAYPRLVLGIMPSGARGLMMAVMIAALMSDLDSIFNSASTIFTLDLWKRMRKHVSNTELMIVGRVFIIVMIGVSIAWVPLIEHFQGGQLFFYIQEVTNYISPPIAAIFLVAMLWRRCSEKGAFIGGLCGSLLGLARLIVIFSYPTHRCGEVDERPAFVTQFHYMYYSALLFIVTIVVTVIVSLFTQPPDDLHVNRLTYWTRYGDDADDEVTSSDHRKVPLCSDVERIELQPMNGTRTKEDSKENDAEDQHQLVIKDDPDPVWKRVFRRTFAFVCGIDNNADEERNDEARVREEEEASLLRSLEQSRTEKIILNVALFMILSIGCGMYLFWSL